LYQRPAAGALMAKGNKAPAGPPRLDPQQLIVAKLFEIADALALREPKGVFESEEIYVTDKWTEVSFGPSISTTLMNNGSDDVYIRMIDREHAEGDPGPNELPWVRKQAPIKKGQTFPINVVTLKAVRMWLICKPNETATVYKYTLS